jgi:DNA-binding SARP family transcriptional activator
VYQALIALVEAPGEIVTREALRTHLWPRDTHLNYEANVNTTVNKLRQVLGDTNEESQYIETIPRKGYSFIAEVAYIDRPTMTPDSNGAAAPERATSNWKFLRLPRFLSSGPARIWFTASVIALVMAAFLFGAAFTLYSHRPVQHEVAAHPGQEAQQNNKP